MSTLTKWCALLGTALALHAPVHAAPEISPTLKAMLGGLPIAGIKDQVQGMVAALGKTPCGGGLQGCYATSSGPLQLYFFTSGSAQQTLLLVVDQQMAMPNLLGEKVQKVMGGTALRSPIVSISTADIALNQTRMPAALQRVVRERYFNVGSLEFSAGVQLAARADLGGPIKLAMEAFGVKGNEVTLRAAVVMPLPADLSSAAGAGAGAADAMAHGATMKKAGADAAKPEAFIELQFAPNAALPLLMPRVTLRDATFFLNNALTFGFKGNATFDGVPNKTILTQFQTPLSPAGALDLLDFSFRMATPANFTMEDAARVMVAMATPDPRLARYGGGFIRNIAAFKQPLLDAVVPLSVFKLSNPVPPPPYRFGDSTKPWPDDHKYFNIVLLGPLAEGGPFMRTAGDVNILGQRMGWLDASAGASGLHGAVGEALTLKLGPLGPVSFRMEALADVSASRQDISLKGNLSGQKVEVTLSGTTLRVAVSASCVNPFEISTTLGIQASTDIAEVFRGQAGVNVDPSKISGCIGKELEAAYNKIAGEYRNLTGYTASAANAELNKIAHAAAAEYNRAKQEVRKAAESSINAASNAWKGGTNAVISGVGGQTARAPDTSQAHFDRSVFDWDYYYDKYPDLVNRQVDLVAHWNTTGHPNRWRGSLEFDPQFYLTTYPDAVMFGSDARSVMLHWVMSGLEEGRMGSADFDVRSYLARYPDLRNAFGDYGYKAAFSHWLSSGRAEGRNGSPFAAAPWTIGRNMSTAWDDYRFCQGQHVVGFQVRAGRNFDGVAFLYANGTWGPAHGNLGRPPYTDDVRFQPGEHVVRVEYRSDDEVRKVTFFTNTGRSFAYGGGGGSPGTYNVTPGQKLGCMAGRSGSRTDQLTFSSTVPQ